MNEDFLNIWVVVHDKATNALETLSHKIKRIDDDTKNLENSISKMDSTQQKNSNTFLQAAKNVNILTQNLNEQAKARKANAAAMDDEAKKIRRLEEVEAARIDKFRKLRDQAYIEDISRDKRAAAEKARQQAQADKDALAEIEKHLRDQARIREKARISEERADATAEREKQRLERETERQKARAARDAARDTERAARSAEREAARFEAAMRRHKPGFTISDLTERNDRNSIVATSALSAGLLKLSNAFHDADKSSNTFYVRILGLRLPLLAVAAGLPPLIGALSQLAGLLVAVADAAALAGAALGGALVASIAQAAPVVGLLVIAFKQLFDIVKLTGQQQKLSAQAAKDATDKSLEHAQYLEQERQAHISLANAQKDLVNARRDALRNIQDLNAAEKESILNSQRATLGLLGAQSALAGLVSGGGSALDIANAQLDVTDASNNVGSARSAQGRASADAARARRQGVSGNSQVIAAQQAIISQQHSMALAAQQYAQQQRQTNQTLTDYNKALNNLDPAQRRLFDAVVALRKEFKNEWKGITDPIINSFTRIVNGITSALKDPEIQSAFRGLSGATAGAINTSTSFFGTPEAKRLFLQVMKDARQNLPLIANILKDITILFGRVAVAAGPFVHVILKGISDFFDDITAKTANSNNLSDFFTVAFKAANAFWQVITGILEIFVVLGEGGAAATGIDLVGKLGQYLHGIAQELKNNPEGVKKFFGDLGTTVDDLGQLLDHILRALVNIANTGAFDALIKLLDTFILPALEHILVIAGKVIVALSNWSLAHPDIIETGALITGVIIITGGLIKQIASAIGWLAKQRAAMVLNALVSKATTAAEVADAEAAAAAMEASWLAMLGPIALVIVAIAAIGTALFLLDKKFHFLAPTFEWLKKAFFDVVNFIGKHWRALMVILGGPIGLVVLTIINNFDSIKKAAIILFNDLRPVFSAIATIAKFIWTHGLKFVFDGLMKIIKFFDENDLTTVFKSAFGAIKTSVDVLVTALNKSLGLLHNIYNVTRDIVTLGGLLGSNGPNGGLNVTPGYTNSPADQKGLTERQRQQAAVNKYFKGYGVGNNSSGSAAGAAILGTASQSIGVPYVWGGTNLSSGVDCSGLVWAAAKQHGINLPRTSQEQARVGQEVSLSDLQPGDLLFYDTSRGPNSHEAIYAGNGQMVVAPHTGTNVQVQPLRTSGLHTIRRIQSELDAVQQGRGADKTGSASTRAVLPSSTRRTPSIAGSVPSTGSSFTTPIIPVSGGGGRDRGPGARGGQAIEVIPGARNLLGDIANGIRVNVWDALHQIALGFKYALGSGSKGYKLMVSAITALDQVFTDQARSLTRLVAAQKHRMVAARYKVSGRIGTQGGNTSVVDTGSDIQDLNQTVTDLGIDRSSISNQLSETARALGQFQRELRNTPNTKANRAKRTLLTGTIKRYQDQLDSLQAALDQNTIDIYQAQNAIIQATIDQINLNVSRATNDSQIKIALAQITGIGKGNIPAFIQLQIDALNYQKGALQGPLQAAIAEGNVALRDQILDELEGIDQSLAEAIQSKFQAVVDSIEESASNKDRINSLNMRINALGGNSYRSLQGAGSILQRHGQDMQAELGQLYYARALATNPAQYQEVTEKIDELTTQIAENTDALRENAEQLKQAQVDRIKNLGAFRGGINSGVGGLLQSLAAGSGSLDTVALLKSLNNQQGNLQQTGAGLRGQLLSQFGINLSSDPKQLIQQLNNTDFGALEFGMDDNTKSTFEDLINSIIENATALSDNTNELAQANNQQNIQDWSSSLWQNFRDALFTGNGGILGGIPQAATGAHILSAGLIRVHSGETVVPAGVTNFRGGDTAPININIDNRGEGDVDPLALSKRLAFEMKVR